MNTLSLKRSILDAEMQSGCRFVCSRRVWNSLRGGGQGACPTCKRFDKKKRKCVWRLACTQEGKILDKLACRCIPKVSTVNRALRVFNAAWNRMIDSGVDIDNLRVPSKLVLKKSHVKRILERNTSVYVVAPQRYDHVEVLSPKHSMFTDSNGDLGNFYTVNSSTKAVSGSGADEWWLVNNDLLRFLKRKTQFFNNKLARRKSNNLTNKDGRLSARKYYKHHGHKAVGSFENIHGHIKELALRENGSPWWKPTRGRDITAR